jgi:hypothetical protein
MASSSAEQRAQDLHLDQDGRRSGDLLDTSTPGVQTFTVTARSKDAQSASRTVSYTVHTVLLASRVRISGIHASPLRHGCAVETGRDEREITALSADAACRHQRLGLRGTIQRAGHLASAAAGAITVSYKVRLPRRLASGTARTTINRGGWHISLVLPAVNLDPLPPSYLITVHYSGDRRTHRATASRRIRLESERAGLQP